MLRQAGSPQWHARKIMKEIYVSTDVETDDPIPVPRLMLSLGSVANLPDKTLVSTFTANL